MNLARSWTPVLLREYIQDHDYLLDSLPERKTQTDRAIIDTVMRYLALATAISLLIIYRKPSVRGTSFASHRRSAAGVPPMQLLVLYFVAVPLSV